MKLSFRTTLVSVLGVALVLAATTGFQLVSKQKPINERMIQVPGDVIARNLDQLMDRVQSGQEIDIPGLGSTDSMPVVEGFNNTKAGLPSTVSPMWDASVLLLGTTDEGAELGTGFIVKIKRVGSSNLVYIVTNNHVIADFCSEVTGACPSLYTLNDIGLNTRTGDVFRTGSNILKVQGARLLKTSRPPDLALLEVEVSNDALNFLKVAPVTTVNPGTGAHVYAIGYPATSRRTSSSRKYIEDQDLIIKRWSEGEVQQVGTLAGQGELVVHSADILPGNSGSGLFNSDGVVVGVNVLLLNVRKDFDYAGGGCGNPETSRASVSARELAPYMNLVNRL